MWLITIDSGKSCQPEVIKEEVKRDTPKITFKHEERIFYVEFQNRSDQFASANGAEADVEILNEDRSKRFKGVAINTREL